MAKRKKDEYERGIRKFNFGAIFTILYRVSTILFMLILIGLVATVITGTGYPTGNIAVIPIEGVITGSSSPYANAGSGMLIDMIENAEQDENVEAIIFKINSPGGSPVGSDEIGQAIKAVEKPTIAVIREVGASGAYWIASACDIIYANRMSFTGSIGVIAAYFEVAEMLDDWNVTYRSFTSGEFKQMGSPFTELKEEEAQKLQKSVDQIHDFFVAEVAMNRGMSEDEVRKLATGELYIGTEALELGLVDRLGTMRDAVEGLEEELNITAELAEYSRSPSFGESLGIRSSGLIKGVEEEARLTVQT